MNKVPDSENKSAEKSLYQFVQLSQMTFWSIIGRVIFFVIAFGIAVFFLLIGLVYIYDQAEPSFKTYFSVALVIVSFIALVSVAKHNPLKEIHKEVKGIIRMNIVYSNYLNQLDYLARLGDAFIAKPGEKKIFAESKKLITQWELLLTNTLGELDSLDDLQD